MNNGIKDDIDQHLQNIHIDAAMKDRIIAKSQALVQLPHRSIWRSLAIMLAVCMVIVTSVSALAANTIQTNAS